ncbi:MAG: DUF1330 domain-containing protein [Flavobacteriaceae bacterium]|nr:DUF1330 domain-containing protein [Flavobacteriaceae bacterium]
MLSNQISPTKSQIAKLQSYPKNTPLAMLNIIKFKEKTDHNETGKETYARYFKNASPFVERAGARLVWKGHVYGTVIGNSNTQPDVIFLIEYPSVQHFFKMISNPEYQKISNDRSLALEYGGLIACQNTKPILK